MHEDPNNTLGKTTEYMYEDFVEYKSAVWADAHNSVPDDRHRTISLSQNG